MSNPQAPQAPPPASPFEKPPDITTRIFPGGSISETGEITDTSGLDQDDIKALSILGNKGFLDEESHKVVKGLGAAMLTKEEDTEADQPGENETADESAVIAAIQLVQENGFEVSQSTGGQSQDERGFNPERNEQIIEASKNLFVDGSSLAVNSKDSDRISDSYETAVPSEGRYPIPTYSAVKKAGGEGSAAPIGKLARAIRKFGVTGFMTIEAFKATEANKSKSNKKAVELLNELQSTGPDGMRALFAREVHPGVWENIHDSRGKEQNAAEVKDARAYWFQDTSHFQAALYYEISKAASEDEFDYVVERAMELINEAAVRRSNSFAGVRFTDSDVIGILVGVGFMHKPTHLSFKHGMFGKDSEGKWKYRGVNSVKYVQEMSTKFKGYTLAEFSPVDVGNLAAITQTALEASIKYKDSPTDPRFIKSQFILQRVGKIVDDMRYSASSDPEGDDAATREIRNAMDSRGILNRPAVRVAEDGKVYLDGQPIRNGSAAAAGDLWKQVAGYSDVATELFPNIKYIKREEFSTLDRRTDSLVAEARLKYTLEHGDDLDFDEELAIETAKNQLIGLTEYEKSDSKISPRKQRKQLRKGLSGTRKERNRESKRLLARQKAIEVWEWKTGLTWKEDGQEQS